MALSRRTLFTDDFSVDGQLGSPDYSTPTGYGALFANSGVVLGDSSVGASLYVGTTMPAKQWAEITLTEKVLESGQGIGLLLRTSSAGSAGYVFSIRYGDCRLYDVTDLNNYLHDFGHNPQVGDVFRMEVDGSDFTLYINEVAQPVISYSDNSSGFVGIFRSINEPPFTTGTLDNFSAGDWVEDGMTVSNVNGDNVVRSNGNIVISGTGLDGVTAVTIEGVGTTALTVTSQSDTEIRCTPVDFIAGDQRFGDAIVRVTDGATPIDTFVGLLPETGRNFVNGSGLSATGLAQLGGVEGDQWEWPESVESSSMVVYESTDFILDSPVSDGTEFTFHLYSGGVWDSGVVTIGLVVDPADDDARWLSDIPPVNTVVGVNSSGSVAQYADGTAPLTFAEVLQQTPTTFTFRSDGTYSGYVPTADFLNVQVRVSNASNPAGELSNLLSVIPTMPEITNPLSRNVTTTSAEITATTPSVVGTLYWIADPNPNEPTPEQVGSGLNSVGEPAELKGTAPITVAGQQPWMPVINGRPGIKYYYWIVQGN